MSTPGDRERVHIANGRAADAVPELGQQPSTRAPSVVVVYTPPKIDHWRISDGWHDVAGNWHAVDEEIRHRLRDSIDSILRSEDQNPPPYLWFVHRGEHHDLTAPCDLIYEADANPSGTVLHDRTSLPTDLPLGCHQLVPRDGGPVTKLFVVPNRQELPGRCWGWAVQAYAMRSAVSWGQGDLGDLAEFASWARSHGATLVSHNPLGDTLPIPTQEPSPYFTSSRRFRSLLYLDIPSVPGATGLGDHLETLTRAGRALNDSPLIDRDGIYRLKLGALRDIWNSIGHTDRVRTFIEPLRADDVLVDHATFNALAHRFGSGWNSWEHAFSHPRLRSVAEFRNANIDEVDFWAWIQSLIDIQYEHAASRGASLVDDLPVGFTPDGSDAWVDQDCLAFDWRIGAPGDEFNPDGQNWGIVPYIPQKLRSLAYEPWRRTLRRIFAHVGMVRIDHVMGLFRLFVLPRDMGGPNGAYLYHHGTEMLDVALMEAAMAGITLVGEDLGTVEAGVREELSRRGIAGYRIALFEDGPPSSWPDASIAALGTHDLPTLAGLLTGEDARSRESAGLDVDLSDDERMRRRIETNFTATSDAPSSATSDEDTDDTATLADQIIKAHQALAAAGSRMVLATIDDACASPLRPNVPGTVDEVPNWRRSLPVTIEHLDSSLAPRIADTMTSRTTCDNTRPGSGEDRSQR